MSETKKSNMVNIQLAFPCDENWNEMLDVENGKHCTKCNNQVIDFTEKGAQDLENELINGSTPLCGRFKKSQLSVSFVKYAATAIIASASTALSATGQETETLDSIPYLNSLESSDNFFGYIVETMPQMKGGLEQFYKNLSSHLKFPQGLNQKVKVFIQFDVDTLGKMVDIKIIKGYSLEVDNEALRAVKQMNQKFTPGTQRGKPVKVRMSLPIIFDPKKDQ